MFWIVSIQIRRNLLLSREKYKQAVDRLPFIKVAIIGDIILDEYLKGEVNRISPEAPVPVVHVRKTDVTLGGSGNVVSNLRAIGVPCIVFARVGKDSNAKVIRDLLLAKGVQEEDIYFFTSPNIPTIIKTRIIAAHQQVCRVDREENKPLSPGEEKLVLESLKEVLPSCSGIVLSDYDKGFLTKGLIPEILSLSKEQKKFVAVDPQVNHFFLYKEAGILTPNHHEAGRALERKLEETEDVELGAIELANKLEAKYMMVTRGEKGMSLYERETKTFHHIPTVAREVYDVTGAGDTVISIFTAFYLAGLNALEASKVANAAAGKVIEKLGAATVSLEELEKQLVKMGVLS